VGDLTTYTQTDWVVTPASTTLTDQFNTVYNATGIVQVGGTFKMTFTDPGPVLAYLPAVGADGPLTSDYADPTSTSSGAFGGDVLALQLDVDFADAGELSGNSGLKFGDLTVCGFGTDTDLNGQTVAQVLGIANTALGGGSTTDSIDDLDTIAYDLTSAFSEGTPSSWAQAHLVDGSCP
jgi:hypothetical protein